jgi:hypothetical protein
MEDILWTDLDHDEERALEMLANAVSAEFCAAIACVTAEVEKLIRASLNEMSAR